MSGGDTQAQRDLRHANHGASFDQLTHKNDELMAEIEWGKTEEVSFKSKDGTEVHGLLTYPVGYQAGTKVPAAAAHPRRTEGPGRATRSASKRNGSPPTATRCCA